MSSVQGQHLAWSQLYTKLALEYSIQMFHKDHLERLSEASESPKT